MSLQMNTEAFLAKASVIILFKIVLAPVLVTFLILALINEVFFVGISDD